MTAQLSREIAAIFRKVTNSQIDEEGNSHCVLTPADCVAINSARMLLAGMDSKPVAVINGAREPVLYGESIGIAIGTHLYTASPAPVAVPDDLLHMAADAIEDLLGNTDHSSSAAAWYDLPGKLRAAMQSFGNSEQLEPVSQRYTLTDGWISEAKNLADLHGLSFVVFRKGEEPQCADPSKVIISFTDEGLGYPAAPEQEV